MPTNDARFAHDTDIDYATAQGQSSEAQTQAEVIDSPGFDGADIKLLAKKAVPFTFQVTTVGDNAADVESVVAATIAARGKIGTFSASLSESISIDNVALVDVRPGPIRQVRGSGFFWIAELGLTFVQVKPD